MSESITLQAFAKINLSLEVLRRREDGYHDIRSFMQDISLSDVVTVSRLPGIAPAEAAGCPKAKPEGGASTGKRRGEIPEDGCFIGELHVEFCMDDDTISHGRDNLAIRGAEALLRRISAPEAATVRGTATEAEAAAAEAAATEAEAAATEAATEAASAAACVRPETAFPSGIRIDVQKRLPIAAGIAGGSGNAAAVMLALDALLGYPLTLRELMDAGAEVGADVPFSLMMNAKKNETALAGLPGLEWARTSAWMSGIGERVEPAEPVPHTVILMNPGIQVSTREVYEAIDSLPERALSEDLYYNIMERYTLERYQEARLLKDAMTAHLQAEHIVMSGSGPTIVAYYDDRTAAERDYREARESSWFRPDWRIWLAESGGEG